MTAPAIKCASLTKRYGDVEVLRDFSFEAGTEEFVTLFGPNGCGKSTLLRLLSGLEAEFEGTLQIDGKAPAESKCGFVFQRVLDSVFPWLTCLQNVLFPKTMRGGTTPADKASARAYLDQVGLGGWESAFPYQLSGGMVQRLSIARMLANEAAVYLMDEPFSALDHFGCLEMESLLLRLWQEEKRRPTIFISHRLDEAILLADKLLLLSPRPATVTREFRIPLPRPRAHTDLLRPEFHEIKATILQELMLHHAVHE